MALTTSIRLEREAMWISLHSALGKKYAIRPFIGGVNGISGETLVGDMNSMMRRMNSISPKQDYLVTPEQLWLDGISTAPGIVKQFVATQMVGEPKQNRRKGGREKQETAHAQCSETQAAQNEPPKGTSIEWQLTGTDAVGGIQLQIIPQHEIGRMHFSNVSNAVQKGDDWISDTPTPQNFYRYLVLETPTTLRLNSGDTIWVKDLKKQQADRPKTVHDLCLRSSHDSLATIDIDIYYEKPFKGVFRVHWLSISVPPTILEVSVIQSRISSCTDMITQTV